MKWRLEDSAEGSGGALMKRDGDKEHQNDDDDHPRSPPSTSPDPEGLASSTPTLPTGAPDLTETEAFHRHLDGCAQCRANPFDLCLRGAVLLRAAADEQDRP
jgi:hypothetical protein